MPRFRVLITALTAVAMGSFVAGSALADSTPATPRAATPQVNQPAPAPQPLGVTNAGYTPPPVQPADPYRKPPRIWLFTGFF